MPCSVIVVRCAKSVEDAPGVCVWVHVKLFVFIFVALLHFTPSFEFIIVIGVIVNGMDDARVDAEIEAIKKAEAALGNSDDALSLENQISALSNQLRDLNNSVARLSKSIEKTPN